MDQDLRVALRGLRRSPGFTTAAVLTLALGIGATSAVFSVVQAVLLAPLPYAEPERRVQVWSTWRSFDKTWLSDQEVVDYRRLGRSWTAVAAWATGQRNLTGDGEPVRLVVGLVTANAFDVLGSAPALGRVFTPEDDRPGGPPVVVLNHALWEGRYGADPAVVGRRILLNDEPAEVIGVMPRGFRLPTDFTEDAAEPTEAWLPLRIDEARLQRGNHGLYAAALLAPGATAASATAELRAITAALTAQGAYHPQMQFGAFAVGVDDEIRGRIRPALHLLAGAVGVLLLIACVNVASLLLVRGEARQREMAVRTALGAPPARIVRQLLVEGALLAAAGAAAGLLLAAAGVGALTRIDATLLPAVTPPRLDLGVVLATGVAALATTILVALLPALRARRVTLTDNLRDGSQQATAGASRQRLRAAFVVAEVALALVLVAGAGLMIRTLGALGRIDLGFAPEGVLTMRVALPQARYAAPEQTVEFVRALVERVRTIPGVASAGFVRALPLATTIGDFGLDVDGYEEAPGRNAKGDWQIVTDGAFEALGTRLVRGRWFTAADRSDGALVTVVNETMARTYWPDGDAVGGRLRVGSDMSRPWLQVVGIVADERHNSVTAAVKEKFFVPHAQWHVATGSAVRSGYLVVRGTRGEPGTLAGAVREQLRTLDPTLPISGVRSMDDVVAAALATPRLTGLLLGVFAGVALALAAVGLYGVLAYLVGLRTQEIGIRLALGAEHRSVLLMVLRQGLGLAVTGVVLGLAVALGAARVMTSVVYGVDPRDPPTFAAVVALLLGIALVASWLPARRATRVDPLVALRAD